MSSTFNLNSLINLAIVESLPASKEIEVGKYKVSGIANLSVDAIITKGKSEMFRPTASLPLTAVIAVFVKRYNIKVAELDEILVEAYKQSLLNESDIRDELDYTTKAMARVTKTLSKLPEQQRAGKTSIKGETKLLSVKQKVDKITTE